MTNNTDAWIRHATMMAIAGTSPPGGPLLAAAQAIDEPANVTSIAAARTDRARRKMMGAV